METKLKKKRKRKPDPSSWNENIQKKKRSLGEEYLGKKYVNGSWVFVEKSKKLIGTLCRREACKRYQNRHCHDFSEEDCRRIFDQYWKVGNKDIQNSFIMAHVNFKLKKDGHDKNDSRRQYTRLYFLKKDGVSVEVCKEMFLSTLSISEKRVSNVLKLDNKNTGIAPNPVKPRNPKPSRGFKWDETAQLFLAEFINKIPKAPSHYCRKDSAKIYLSSIVPTMSKLYGVYKARCDAFGRHSFGIKKFYEYFNKKNYSLFKRKKDMCNTCIGYEEGNISEAVFTEHQGMKNEALLLKEHDKNTADNISNMVITLLTRRHYF